jgi:hypothetical protein
VEIEYCSTVILMDCYYKCYILGWVALGLFYIIYSTARPKVVKMAVGIAVILKTITLAKDRSVNKPYLNVAL